MDEVLTATIKVEIRNINRPASEKGVAKDYVMFSDYRLDSISEATLSNLLGQLIGEARKDYYQKKGN